MTKTGVAFLIIALAAILFVANALLFSETQPPKVLLRNLSNVEVLITIRGAAPAVFSQNHILKPNETKTIDPFQSISLRRRPAVEIVVNAGKGRATWRADGEILDAYARESIEVFISSRGEITFQPPWLRHTDWNQNVR
jgi:hypothetical protein